VNRSEADDGSSDPVPPLAVEPYGVWRPSGPFGRVGGSRALRGDLRVMAAGAVANVPVFVGARPYLLTEQEARRLAQLLRDAFTDEKFGEATAALRLAWAIELAVDEGPDEPLEIGWPQAKAVIRAVPEVTAQAHDGLDVLRQAARRLGDDAAP
jgi:hypothetical protein